MTKTRLPISVDTALARIAGQVGGWPAMADAVGYHERTVRAWGDPDRDEQISLDNAIKLDILFQANGGIGAPLLEAHRDMTKVAIAEAFADKQELQIETIDLHRESSEAVAALFELSQPNAGPAEQVVAEREALQARQKWDRVLVRIASLRRKPPSQAP